MNSRNLLLVVLIFLFVVILASVLIPTSNSLITSFDECVAAGFPVMESYPRQCTAGGQNFTEVVPESIDPNPLPPDQVVCTMDAKICPDGSSVGRTGPNCEFSPCPY